MALTQCPECRGQVSDQATACPHCGHPLTPAPQSVLESLPIAKSSTPVAGVGACVLLFLCLLIGKGSMDGNPHTNPLATLGGSQHLTIRLSGTDGLKFEGSYMEVQPSGASSSKSVEGTVPAEYETDGSMVSCSFQKQSESGTLHLDLVDSGETVKSAETRAAYGVVSVAK